MKYRSILSSLALALCFALPASAQMHSASNPKLAVKQSAQKKQVPDARVGAVSVDASPKYNAETLKYLDNVATIANSECPLPVIDGMHITNIKFDKATREFRYLVKVTAPAITYEMMKSSVENPQTHQASLLGMVGNPEFTQVAETLISVDGSIVMDYYFFQTGQHLLDKYTTSEIRAQLNKKSSNNEDFSSEVTETEIKWIENEVAATNKTCPLQVDDVTMLKTVYVSGNTTYYIYEVDENKAGVTVNDLASVKDILRTGIVENVKSKGATRLFAKRLGDNGYKMIHRYVGKKTGQQLDISFTSEQLKSIGNYQ